MCDYCEKKTCESCTTSRGSSKCLHCEQKEYYSFKWNYCPMCGEIIKITAMGNLYEHIFGLDFADYKVFRSETKSEILLLGKNGTQTFVTLDQLREMRECETSVTIELTEKEFTDIVEKLTCLQLINEDERSYNEVYEENKKWFQKRTLNKGE